MCKSITVSAPAKINIGLEVFPKRQDGYHDIKSIFTVVNLCDELTVSLSGQNNSCVVECDNFALPKENTFTKAYKAFCVLTGVSQGVCVKLIKHIPAGGGLGGGSSDASSFLQSMDTLFCTRLTREDFYNLSSQIGSDVFFFTEALISKKHGLCNTECFAAEVGGRGEVIHQIDARTDLKLLLVFPGVSVSTKEAYSLVDAKKDWNSGKFKSAMKQNACSSLEMIYRKPVHEWFFQNDFTSPVVEVHREIGFALNCIKECNADFADMSGSGSTVYGVFEDAEYAEKAFSAALERWNAVLV